MYITEREKDSTLFVDLDGTLVTTDTLIESFNGKLRDELLNREIFDSLFEAKLLVERWRKEYNQIRPHSSLGYRPPAPETIYPNIQQFDKSLVN